MDNAGTGLLGFGVVLLLLVASFLLFRSMSTRLRNVRRNAPHWPDAPPPRETAPDPTEPGDGPG